MRLQQLVLPQRLFSASERSFLVLSSGTKLSSLRMNTAIASTFLELEILEVVSSLSSQMIGGSTSKEFGKIEISIESKETFFTFACRDEQCFCLSRDRKGNVQ